MNKTEKRKLIIKTFCEFINENLPEWLIDDHGEGGRMTIYALKQNEYNDNGIEFSRGSFDLCSYSGCDEETLRVEKLLQEKLTEIITNVLGEGLCIHGNESDCEECKTIV